MAILETKDAPPIELPPDHSRERHSSHDPRSSYAERDFRTSFQSCEEGQRRRSEGCKPIILFRPFASPLTRAPSSPASLALRLCRKDIFFARGAGMTVQKTYLFCTVTVAHVTGDANGHKTRRIARSPIFIRNFRGCLGKRPSREARVRGDGIGHASAVNTAKNAVAAVRSSFQPSGLDFRTQVR